MLKLSIVRAKITSIILFSLDSIFQIDMNMVFYFEKLNFIDMQIPYNTPLTAWGN